MYFFYTTVLGQHRRECQLLSITLNPLKLRGTQESIVCMMLLSEKSLLCVFSLFLGILGMKGLNTL